VIAFDFAEALSFDGETGPYLQYAAVRGSNILAKLRESEPEFNLKMPTRFLNGDKLGSLLADSDDIWELVYTAARLEEIVQQIVVTLEPATIAKYAFTLAQRFSLFYHRYRIISEEDDDKRMFY
jgi:arginyl-tRNA synthetase